MIRQSAEIGLWSSIATHLTTSSSLTNLPAKNRRKKVFLKKRVLKKKNNYKRSSKNQSLRILVPIKTLAQTEKQKKSIIFKRRSRRRNPFPWSLRRMKSILNLSIRI